MNNKQFPSLIRSAKKLASVILLGEELKMNVATMKAPTIAARS